MKYIKFIACMAAVAFSFTFASCSSEDDDMEIVRTVTGHRSSRDSIQVKEKPVGVDQSSFEATSTPFNK